ncbi:hypothetical protein [Dethiothermospora halolimnae]|uniref:hypothetical protein n=1 Tax=Dethiothermospora halolimnae TaxID=3114390 RepID=UPI003CCBC8EB
MGNWLNDIPQFERLFWYLAVPFSVVFVIQTILTFTGLGGEGDFDIDVDGADGDSMFDSGNFPFFSVRNFVIFFTVFGWSGIVFNSNGASKVLTIIVSVLLGLITMFIVASIFYFMSKMTESGNMNLNNALFETGDVYLTIPENRSGVGKVHITIQGSLREVDAITDGEKIPTGSTVRVLEVINNQKLLVEKIYE